MTRRLWNWSRKRFSLLLLLIATGCMTLALGDVVRGITWSLLMPVSLFAVVVGWRVGSSGLNAKQAGGLLGLSGLMGIFLYIAGVIRPLLEWILTAISFIPSIVQTTFEGRTIDATPLLEAWSVLSVHVTSVVFRVYEWCVALVNGNSIMDPLAAAFVWSLVLWATGAWAGWQLHRNRRALVSLAPGGIVLALVLDYTNRHTGLVILFLAILLALMGMATNESLHTQWRRRGLDYSGSIAVENAIMVGLISTGMVILASVAPSISWQDLVDRLRAPGQDGADRMAESLGLQAPPNVANTSPYRTGGLPRQHLLYLPPERMEDVVLVISTGELPPLPEMIHDLEANRYYWRSVTYDLYSGAGWGSSAAQQATLTANTFLLEQPQDYRILNQHIKGTPGQQTVLFWAGILAQANVDLQVAWRMKPPMDPSPSRNGDMLGVLTDVDEYDVVSYISQINADALRETESDYPAEVTRRYLQLPKSTPERVIRLARELTQADLTPYDRALSIETHLRTFPYTLDVEPPPPGRDVVDYFLFSAKQGYCDYYATSMAVLARAVGLPARVVIGYAGGEYHSPKAEYIIRQKDAHTWVEIYFSGIGWVEFEPTAGQPSITRTGQGSAPQPRPDLSAGRLPAHWLETLWTGLVTSMGGRFLIAGIVSFLILLLWQVMEICILLLLPSSRVISRMYLHLERSSLRLLPNLPGGHTPHQLQFALTEKLNGGRSRVLRAVFSKADQEIERVISIYVTQVFSSSSPTNGQIRSAVRSWSRLRWRLWVAFRWRRGLS